MEEWRDIPGYRWYKASSLGRILSDAHIDRSGRNRRAKVLKPQATGAYSRVKVECPDGKSKLVSVHLLVAAAFIGQRPDGLEINHRDGNPANNAPDNLEYITHLENIRHSHEVLGHTLKGRRFNHGSKHGMAKLHERDVEAIRQRLSLGDTQRNIAVAFRVSVPTISMIANGHIWRHV